MSLDFPEIPINELKLATSPNPDAWSSLEATKHELARFNRPVNYDEVIDDTTRVLFFGENHPNSPIREHIANNASALRAAGITHLAIEFPNTEQNLQRLRDLPQRLAQGSFNNLTV